MIEFVHVLRCTMRIIPNKRFRFIKLFCFQKLLRFRIRWMR